MSSCTPPTLVDAPGIAPGGLAGLPDAALVRICACFPGATEASGVLSAVGEVFDWLGREQRLTAHAAGLACAGHVLVMGWVGSPITGCAGGRVNRQLGEMGERLGVDLLTPPPLVVEVEGAWTCLNRAGLRAAAAAGRIGPATRVVDTQLTELGAWRRQGLTSIEKSWVGRLLGR